MRSLFSKRLFLLTFCFVVLFVALGASSYWLYGRVCSLKSRVDSLQEEIDRMKNELSQMNGAETFVFEFPPWEQNIVDGTLCMELTFTLKQENLSIIAKVNDDEIDDRDYFGIVVDRDDDGQLKDEPALAAFADNTTIPAGLSSEGYLEFYIWPKEPSEFHTCVFEPNVGYTFNASFPLVYYDDSGVPHYTSSDLVHVCYKDGADQSVHVCFHFGTP